MRIIISGSVPTINAYATSPLTQLMTNTVQHGIYDGSLARFGNRMLEVKIYDQPEFHGISHYELRKILDGKGALDPFLIVDAQAPDTDAVWYVLDSEFCKENSNPELFSPRPPPIYPGEDFVLWQAHMRISDVPSSLASWDIGCGDVVETIMNYYPEYDPQDPQHKIIELAGVNWTDRETQASRWGYAYLRANWSEVEWSDDPNDRKFIMPKPPFVVRLTAEAARESGLRPVWSSKQGISKPGDEVQLIASYDWDSPVWPTGYPNDLSRNRTIDYLQLPQAPRLVNGNMSLPHPSVCSTNNSLRQDSCGLASLE